MRGLVFARSLFRRGEASEGALQGGSTGSALKTRNCVSFEIFSPYVVRSWPAPYYVGVKLRIGQIEWGTQESGRIGRGADGGKDGKRIFVAFMVTFGCKVISL